MNSLKSLAQQVSRGGQEFLLVTEAGLRAWAQSQNLSPRQALEAALEEGIFPECYERNFPSLSAPEQLRLFLSSVLVVGLGGLGGCQALLLARLGVGRLLLADGDVFTPANLNRQLLATHHTLGQNKARVTARHLADLNDGLIVEAIDHFLDAGNLHTYLPQVQVVLDALDTISARLQLFDAAHHARVPLVHGAVLGKFGQVTTIMPDDTLSFAKLYPPAAASSESGREVLAPTVTVTASLQVQEAVRLILGHPPAYQGHLAHFDGDTGRLEILPLG